MNEDADLLFQEQTPDHEEQSSPSPQLQQEFTGGGDDPASPTTTDDSKTDFRRDFVARSDYDRLAAEVKDMEALKPLLEAAKKDPMFSARVQQALYNPTPAAPPPVVRHDPTPAEIEAEEQEALLNPRAYFERKLSAQRQAITSEFNERQNRLLLAERMKQLNDLDPELFRVVGPQLAAEIQATPQAYFSNTPPDVVANHLHLLYDGFVGRAYRAQRSKAQNRPPVPREETRLHAVGGGAATPGGGPRRGKYSEATEFAVKNFDLESLGLTAEDLENA